MSKTANAPEVVLKLLKEDVVLMHYCTVSVKVGEQGPKLFLLRTFSDMVTIWDYIANFHSRDYLKELESLYDMCNKHYVITAITTSGRSLSTVVNSLQLYAKTSYCVLCDLLEQFYTTNIIKNKGEYNEKSTDLF